MKDHYISEFTMDEPDRSGDLLGNVSLVPQMRNDIVTDSTVLKTSSSDSVPSSELLSSQYVSMHRVTDISGKVLTDHNLAAASHALLNRELLTHNGVHNSLVVDMMVPTSNDFVTQNGAAYYEADDDLLNHELTEEDRTLAAALVAVQLVQQQKQSNVIVSTGNLPSLTPGVSPITSITSIQDVTKSPGTTSILSSYMQAVQEESQILESTHCDREVPKLYQPHVLPPLKKILSNHQPLTPRSRFMRPQAEKEELQITLEPQENLSHPGNAPVNNLEMSDIKTEDEDSDDIFMDDDDDSDYSIHNDLRPYRKSLPHKKRIPRKLKNIKKTVETARLKCGRCGQRFPNQTEFSKHCLTHNNVPPKKPSFNCELCGKSCNNQLKFFEHLKSHYEPCTTTSVGSEVVTLNTDLLNVNPDKETAVLIPKDDQSQPSNQPSLLKDRLTTDSSATINCRLTTDTATINCNQCGKVFRRQKALETHMNIVHPKNMTVEEFSEPEDLMEGIRSVVEGGVGETGDEADIDCLSTSLGDRTLKITDKVKMWYREEDLHAAEADLKELEEQQREEEHQQQLQLHHEDLQHEDEELQLGSDDDNICEICGDIYESTEALSEHLNEKHSDLVSGTAQAKSSQIIIPIRRRSVPKKTKKSPTPVLNCPDCGKTFNHRNSLVYHMRSHSGERPHQCEICGKSFFAASALKVHMRLHSGDKPYKCELCDRLFRQWGDLKYHCISIHSEEKNFQCEYCGKDFARKYSLIVHRRIHTGEKNYKCEFCGKSFRASSYLQNHRRIHTGEKPHPCEVCGKPFRVRSDMKRHLNTHARNRFRGTSSNASVGVVQVTTKLEIREPDCCPEDHLRAEEDEHSPEATQDNKLTIIDTNLGQLASVEPQSVPDLHPVTEITIDAEGDTILPDDRQPINLNIALPRTLTQTLSPGVAEQVLYARDPLETVRDATAGTLYVWPIYMT